MAEKASFHTIESLASDWQVSERTVRREIERGNLKAVRIGAQIRISAADKADYERRNRC